GRRLAVQQACGRPRLLARTLRLGEEGEEISPPRDAPLLHRGLQRRANLSDFPPGAREELRPFFRRKLQRRARTVELSADLPLHHAQQPRRDDIENPAMKTATLSEIVGERARVLRCQVD